MTRRILLPIDGSPCSDSRSRARDPVIHLVDVPVTLVR